MVYHNKMDSQYIINIFTIVDIVNLILDFLPDIRAAAVSKYLLHLTQRYPDTTAY